MPNALSLSTKLLKTFLNLTFKKRYRNLRNVGFSDIEKSRKRFAFYEKLPVFCKHININTLSLNGLQCEIVSHHDADFSNIIVHLHGGAYLFGSPRLYRNFAARLSKHTKMPVLLPDYALAPEHKYPTALNQTTALLKWLQRNTHRISTQLSAKNIFMSGDSAGGGLALSTAIRLQKQGCDTPSALVLYSPWLDLTGSNTRLVELDDIDDMLWSHLIAPVGKFYAGEVTTRHAEISPLFADINELIPTFIQTGSDEILLADTESMIEKNHQRLNNLEHKIYNQLPHAFPSYGFWTKDCVPMFDDSAHFFNRFVQR